VQSFFADEDTAELEEKIRRIPKPGEEGADLSDRFIQALDIAANCMQRENRRLKQETEMIRNFAGAQEETHKSLLERILKK